MAATAEAERTIQLLHYSRRERLGVFRVRARRVVTHYVFREIPCDIGGRGFAVHRLGLGTLYHVRVGTPGNCSCECLGFLRHGYCRHVLGLDALLRGGFFTHTENALPPTPTHPAAGT